MIWLFAAQAWAAMTCEDVLFLVRSDVPRANIMHTLLYAELAEGAGECLLRKGVPMEYIEAAVTAPPQPRAQKPAPAAPVAVPQPPPPPAAPQPAAILRQPVDIEVVGLQIGAAKTGGAQWDGPGVVDAEKLRALLNMANKGVDPATISSQVAEWGGTGKARPDPLGFVELRGPNTPEDFQGKRLPFDKRGSFAKDTFNPRFARSYGFRGVSIGEQDGLQVTVQDMEFQSKEMIGVAEVNFEDLAVAFDAAQVTAVYVGTQTNGQLLHVLISVRPSSVGAPEAVGPLY